jgi:hypothetical protein
LGNAKATAEDVEQSRADAATATTIWKSGCQ